jgi:hypothetical protein
MPTGLKARGYYGKLTKNENKNLAAVFFAFNFYDYRIINTRSDPLRPTLVYKVGCAYITLYCSQMGKRMLCLLRLLTMTSYLRSSAHSVGQHAQVE